MSVIEIAQTTVVRHSSQKGLTQAENKGRNGLWGPERGGFWEDISQGKAGSGSLVVTMGPEQSKQRAKCWEVHESTTGCKVWP